MNKSAQPPSSHPVVFWDIDGTLLDTSMERLFLRFLLRNRYVHPFRLPANLMLLGLTSFPPRWYRVKALYIRNISVANLKEWVNICFLKDILPHLRVGGVEVFATLQKYGARQVLLSGSLLPLAERLGEYLGIGEIIAAAPEAKCGMYTGRLSRPHPHALYKKLRAEDWLRANGLDWHKTVAVANHYDDRHLLASCARPVAAFPDVKLLRLAKAKNWTVLESLADFEKSILPDMRA